MTIARIIGRSAVLSAQRANIIMNSDMRKLLAIGTLLLALGVAPCEAQQMNVSVDSVGTLALQLPDTVRYKVSDLKITGRLNGVDLKLLSQIVARQR